MLTNGDGYPSRPSPRRLYRVAGLADAPGGTVEALVQITLRPPAAVGMKAARARAPLPSCDGTAVQDDRAEQPFRD